MKESSMLVNKPQFDTILFKVGKGICVRNNEFPPKSIDAIISEVNPLSIKVLYLDTEDDHVLGKANMREMVISVEDVVSSRRELLFLVKAE